jgi:hypothetical protein
MKKLISLNKGVRYFIAIFSILFFLSSCEDDFTTIGGDFVNTLNLPDPYVVQNLASYSDNIQSVQSNTLNNYLLGKFGDDIFGETEIAILTQLELGLTDPDFGVDPELDSVILTLPLFSGLIDVDTYRIDSVFGTGTFKISVFESNQFLSDLDPGDDGSFENLQLYYSDQFAEFESNISDIPLYTSDEITPSDSTQTQVFNDRLDSITVDTLRLSPRLRLKLPVNFFQEKILNNQNSVDLVSQSSFKNFLRGIYLKTEQVGTEDVMVNFNLNNPDANITLFYRSLRPPPSLEIIENPEFVETFNKFTLNFAGNIINFYDNSQELDLSNQDIENGEENLFIKGGEGIVTIIEPFNGPDNDNNGVSDEIDELRENNWLINEANLVLYIDDELAGEDIIDRQPSRIFAYDLDRDRVLIDYNLDPGGSQNPFTSRLTHLGPLQQDESGNLFYKIRITSHINNIINNDSTNTRIGVVVTQNVNQARILDVRESQLGQIESFIESTISTPRGTVFHGNLSSSEELRLKLQIYYTDPN